MRRSARAAASSERSGPRAAAGAATGVSVTRLLGGPARSAAGAASWTKRLGSVAGAGAGWSLRRRPRHPAPVVVSSPAVEARASAARATGVTGGAQWPMPPGSGASLPTSHSGGSPSRPGSRSASLPGGRSGSSERQARICWPARSPRKICSALCVPQTLPTRWAPSPGAWRRSLPARGSRAGRMTKPSASRPAGSASWKRLRRRSELRCRATSPPRSRLEAGHGVPGPGPWPTPPLSCASGCCGTWLASSPHPGKRCGVGSL
jgi:hypothetical protein